jgi:hypothetical protein
MPIRHLRQFRHPAAREHTARVLVAALLDRVVDTHRVHARRARLHLHLRPVNARLVIGEHPRQMRPAWPAREPQVIGCDSPPASLRIRKFSQPPWRGTACRHRQKAARLAPSPRPAAARVTAPGPQPLIHLDAGSGLERRLILQLLHEVVAPGQPRLEALQDCRASRSACPSTAPWRAAVACATSRPTIVPQARCGESREQAHSPVSGEDIARPIRPCPRSCQERRRSSLSLPGRPPGCRAGQA